MLSRQTSVQIENLQEQLQAIATQRDRAVMDLASIQEQAYQYQTSLSNLQLVLEQFQRGMVCPIQKCIIIHLMYGPEGNSSFCFPASPNVTRGKHQDSRENKTN